jgi:glycosyltransferase involved in cell wall biosynthesis
MRRRALQHIDRIIAVSQTTATRAASTNRLYADRLRVLPSPLDPEFPVAGNVGAHDGLRLLTVGRIDAAEGYKGHRETLTVLPSLQRRFPNLQYDIAGDGDGRADLERLASRLGLNGSVHFHGIVSEATLASLYGGADVFVMPSRGEGFGLVFLEAMAHGLPVVAGNDDAAGEVVRDGETGVLVDPSSSDDLEAAIADILTDSRRRAAMSAAARSRVCTVFSYEHFRTRLEEQLRDL